MGLILFIRDFIILENLLTAIESKCYIYLILYAFFNNSSIFNDLFLTLKLKGSFSIFFIKKWLET
jgi:hypothetical protein